MSLAQVDLNLLVTLDALLDTRSVTRTARRLGRTQPAVSQALSRLREVFGDPLLVRAGREMVPSPRAETLREPLRRLLSDTAALIDGEVFYPSTTTRRFGLLCPDMLGPFLPDLLSSLWAEAPGMRLEVLSPVRDDLAGALASGAGQMALGPLPVDGPGLVAKRLGSVDFAVVVRREHPLTRGSLTAADWVRWPHVVIKQGNDSRNRVADAIGGAGLSRSVALEVPSFLVAPLVVARTDLVLAAPRAIVEPLVAPLGLVLLDPPFPLPVVGVGAVWHERYAADPGHAWFRDRVCAAVSGILSARRP